MAFRAGLRAKYRASLSQEIGLSLFSFPENSGANRSDTILSGALELWRQGLWAIAAIVFVASIVIPVLKLVGLGWLLLNARRGPPWICGG